MSSTIAQAEGTIKGMAGALYALSTEELIGKARDALSKLARVSDANAATRRARHSALGMLSWAGRRARHLIQV